MVFLIIILVLLLIAAVMMIFHQKEKNDVQREFINLYVQKLKDLESENAALKIDTGKLIEKDKGEFQGHH